MLILNIIARILTLVLYLLTILSAYGGYVPPRLWALPSLMVLVFPYLLSLSMLTALIWLLRRKIFMAIGGAVAVIVSWPVATAFPVAFSSTPKEPSFSIMTYNVFQYLDYINPENKGASPTLSYILNSNADIVCLQESTPLKSTQPEIQQQMDSLQALYPYIVDKAPAKHTMDNHSFLLLSKYPAKYCTIPWWLTPDCTLYQVQLPGMPLYVLNVHLTSYQLSADERSVVSDIGHLRASRNDLKRDKSLYHKLLAAFPTRQEVATNIRHIIDSVQGPMIVCGDFNDVPGSYTYRTVRGKDLDDAAVKTVFGPMITYNAHGLWFHIDQILYRGNITPHKVTRGSLRSSDHYPVEAVFSYTPDRRK